MKISKDNISRIVGAVFDISCDFVNYINYEITGSEFAKRTAKTAASTAAGAGGAWAGAAIGTAIFPGIGTAVGATIGGLATGFGVSKLLK
ncbi:hypothetical protein [Succinimonas sp.]|uniref:hypothetical protein n=1 Tax=Succinimonas sp. TaxID=1936151 RepID=UPI00386EA8AE